MSSQLEEDTDFKRSWEAWLASSEGRLCRQWQGLCPAASQGYLENRLHYAFTAGWNARTAPGDAQ